MRGTMASAWEQLREVAASAVSAGVLLLLTVVLLIAVAAADILVPHDAATPLVLRVDAQGRLDEVALAAGAPVAQPYALPARPGWVSLLVEIPPELRTTGAAIEFSAVTVQRMEVRRVVNGVPRWESADLSRGGPPWLRATARGFAFTFGPGDPPAPVVMARVWSEGSGGVAASGVPSESYRTGLLAHERVGGALTGAVVLVALIMLTLAVTTRGNIFVHFAGYLLCAFLIAWFAGGYARTWLPVEMAMLRSPVGPRLAQAGSVFFGALLFGEMFHRELAGYRGRWLVGAMAGAGTLMLVLAPLLPDYAFGPLMGGLVGGAVLTVLVNLAHVYRVRPTGKMLLYGAGWIALLAGGVGDVLDAYGWLGEGLGRFLTHEHSVVASALLLSGAVAHRLREHKEAREHALDLEQAASAMLRDTLDAVPIGVVALNESGGVQMHNRAFGLLVGASAEESALAGVAWGDLFGASTLHEIQTQLARAPFAELEILNSYGTGKHWYRVRAASSVQHHIICAMSEVTRRKTAEYQLRFLAHHDPLTSLLNRRGFSVRFASAQAAMTGDTETWLAYLDLEGFRAVNQSAGHQAGDEALREVATRLRARVSDPHSVARLGGGDFLLLLCDVTRAQALALCQRSIDAICLAPITAGDQEHVLGAVVGLAPVTKECGENENIAMCDRACLRARESGDINRVELANPVDRAPCQAGPVGARPPREPLPPAVPRFLP